MKFQIDHERNPIKLVSEMTNIFSIPAAEKHFQRHLFQSGKAGGTFIPSIRHLNDLLQIIHSLEPIESKEQGRMRKAFVFSHNAPIGYMGITQRLPEHESRLEYEYRDRIRIAYLPVDEWEMTPIFTVIAQWSKSQWNIITAHPGGVSYPFPSGKMEQPLKAAAQDYWQRHVLLKKREV
jgi:hypothetical protein